MKLCSNFDVDNNKCKIKDIQFEEFRDECQYQKTCKLFRVESLETLAIIHDEKIKDLDNRVGVLNREYDYLERLYQPEPNRDLESNDDNFKFVIFLWVLVLTFISIPLIGHVFF